MSGQVSRTLEGLAQAIDDLDLPTDSGVLSEAFALVDRLNAKLLVAGGEHDAVELWRNDGSTSMTAWLRHHTGRSGRDAARCARTARRLRQLPVTPPPPPPGRAPPPPPPPRPPAGYASSPSPPPPTATGCFPVDRSRPSSPIS